MELSESRDLPAIPTADLNESPISFSPALYPSGLKLVLITIGLVLGIFLAALDATIVATAIPSITDEFGSIGNIAWYGSAYSITNTALQSCWGKAYKYFPLKTTFLSAIFVFEIGNVICATATSSTVLIAGRVVSGIGGGGTMTGAFIIIALTAKPRYRDAYMGVTSVTFGASSVLGPLMGGWLTDGPGWRWCFWVSLPIGFSAALVMLLFFKAPIMPKEGTLKHRILQTDVLGGILLSGALSCFVLAMHWSGIYGWANFRSVLAAVSFVLLMAIFVANEWQMGDKAMVQRRLLANGVVLPNLIFVFFLAGLYFPLLYTLPIQFQSVHGTSAAQSGVRLIPLALGISVFTAVMNVVLTFWRHYKPFVLIGALLGTAGVARMYTLGLHASTAQWVVFELLAAVGIGLALQLPMLANQAAVAVDDIGDVTTLTLFCENLGTSFFIAATEAAFSQGLMASISRNIPELEPHAVLNLGATQIRQNFTGEELHQVQASYLDGCHIATAISMACGLVACVVAMGSAGKEIKLRLKKVHSP